MRYKEQTLSRRGLKGAAPSDVVIYNGVPLRAVGGLSRDTLVVASSRFSMHVEGAQGAVPIGRTPMHTEEKGVEIAEIRILVAKNSSRSFKEQYLNGWWKYALKEHNQ